MTATVEAARPDTTPRTRARRRAGRRVAIWGLRAAVVAAFLAAWQYQGTRSDYWELVVSTPVHVARSVQDGLLGGRWWTDIAVTLQEALLGYVLGVLVGLVLVALAAPSRLVARFLAPFIAVVNAMPKIALAPLFILWFGTTLQSKILFVTSLIAFIVFYGALTGLRSIDPQLVANARVLGAGRAELVRHVFGPATVSYLVASLRLSFAWALLAAVVAEYLGANRGVGFVIASAQQTLRTDTVIAGILIVAVTAVLIDQALVVVEARLTRWKAA